MPFQRSSLHCKCRCNNTTTNSVFCWIQAICVVGAHGSCFCICRSAANAWLPTYVTVNLYFSGFVILTDKIPAGWQWFAWTSFMRYSWGAMMVNNFEDSEPGRLAVFFDSEGNAQAVLEFYGMADGSVMSSTGACLGLLSAVLAFFTVLGVLALVYIRHDKR